MANLVTVTTLVDGPRTTILHVYIQGDGTGEVENYELVDPDDTQYPKHWDGFFSLESLQSGLTGFSATLKFEYLIDGNLIWNIPEYDSSADFCAIGGLKDRSNPLDGTGKVLLSTQGLGNGDEGSLVITLTKN
jgi:hypothetical protein